MGVEARLLVFVGYENVLFSLLLWPSLSKLVLDGFVFSSSGDELVLV